EAQRTKSEYRNPKSETNPKTQTQNTKRAVFLFWNSFFEIGICFGFRASVFGLLLWVPSYSRRVQCARLPVSSWARWRSRPASRVGTAAASRGRRAPGLEVDRSSCKYLMSTCLAAGLECSIK